MMVLGKTQGVRIVTNSFTKEEEELLVLALETKFNIKSTLHKNNLSGRYSVVISNDSIDLLRRIVKPYILPSMLHKIGIFPFDSH